MPEFSPDADIGASLASRWKTWLTEFEMFLTASGITDTKRKRALLLYQAGATVREIFEYLFSITVSSQKNPFLLVGNDFQN